MSKRARYRAIFLIGGSLLGLIGAELALRISNVWVGRHSDTMFLLMGFDETLGWKMKPNVSETIDAVIARGLHEYIDGIQIRLMAITAALGHEFFGLDGSGAENESQAAAQA